jgi:hypothetical protein
MSRRAETRLPRHLGLRTHMFIIYAFEDLAEYIQLTFRERDLRMSPGELDEWKASNSFHAEQLEALGACCVRPGGILAAIRDYGDLYGLHLDIDPDTRGVNYVYYTTPTPGPIQVRELPRFHG